MSKRKTIVLTVSVPEETDLHAFAGSMQGMWDVKVIEIKPAPIKRKETK